MSVRFLVGLLSYWNKTTIGISLVIEISFWIVLEAFLERFHNEVKYFWISCISVSLLVSLLPYWNYVNIGISPVLDDIYFWNFWRHSRDIFELFPKYSVFLVCLSVCLSVSYISSNWTFPGVNFWDLWSCWDWRSS